MKLIFCPVCHDMHKLQITENVECLCGESWGHYSEDGLNASYGGKAVPVGIANSSFVKAINDQPKNGMGKTFEAFVIPAECDTFKKEEG